MAERDRYDWDRDRGRDWDRERTAGRGYDRDRGYADDDRGMMSRGADEVRSWFGDDEARRRRDMDEARDRQERGWDFAARDRDRDRGWAANSDATRREHGWGSSREGGRWENHSREPRMHESTREWYDRGPNAGGVWSSSHTYGFGAPNWTGGQGETGSTRGFDADRQYPRSAGGASYGGGYGSTPPNPSFSGGYGAGTYESGNWSSQQGSGYGGTSTGEGRRGSLDRGSEYGYGRSTPWAVGNFAGRGPRSYQRSDDRIREDVNERLTADPRVDASDIDVRVQNGEVFLSGTVDDRRTRRLAEEIIEDLPGVRDVRNDLRVDRGSWSGGSSDRDDQSGFRAGMDTSSEARDRKDGAIGNTGDPQKRDDVTTLNQTGKINR